MDFAYLEGFAAGDRQVVAEVLAMYLEQAALWQARLTPPADDWGDVVHTIKGASRGIGANALGDRCERMEAGGLDGIAEVLAALAETVVAVETYLARDSGR